MRYLLDTHAILWFLAKDNSLSSNAKEGQNKDMSGALRGGPRIGGRRVLSSLRPLSLSKEVEGAK